MVRRVRFGDGDGRAVLDRMFIRSASKIVAGVCEENVRTLNFDRRDPDEARRTAEKKRWRPRKFEPIEIE